MSEEAVEPTDLLAKQEDVIKRLEEEPTERMLVMIPEYLGDASDEARDIGLRKWNSENVPRPVSRIVAAVVARFLRNPDGLSQSRAADETLAWDEPMNRPYFEPEERERIKRQALLDGDRPQQAFGNAEVYAWGRGRGEPEVVNVPWGTNGGKPFPLVQINDPDGYYAWEG